LVEQMRRIEPSWRMEASFLELAEPTIEQAIEGLSAQGFRRILVVPILLFTAAHAKSDIPDAVSEFAAKHGITVVGQTPSLGTAREVIVLSNRRYIEITSQAHEAIYRAGGRATEFSLGIDRLLCRWGAQRR
jgi:sirohydrochlorin ferrochelatase